VNVLGMRLFGLSCFRLGTLQSELF